MSFMFGCRDPNIQGFPTRQSTTTSLCQNILLT